MNKTINTDLLKCKGVEEKMKRVNVYLVLISVILLLCVTGCTNRDSKIINLIDLNLESGKWDDVENGLLELKELKSDEYELVLEKVVKRLQDSINHEFEQNDLVEMELLLINLEKIDSLEYDSKLGQLKKEIMKNTDDLIASEKFADARTYLNEIYMINNDYVDKDIYFDLNEKPKTPVVIISEPPYFNETIVQFSGDNLTVVINGEIQNSKVPINLVIGTYDIEVFSTSQYGIRSDLTKMNIEVEEFLLSAMIDYILEKNHVMYDGNIIHGLFNEEWTYTGLYDYNNALTVYIENISNLVAGFDNINDEFRTVEDVFIEDMITEVDGLVVSFKFDEQGNVEEYTEDINKEIIEKYAMLRSGIQHDMLTNFNHILGMYEQPITIDDYSGFVMGVLIETGGKENEFIEFYIYDQSPTAKITRVHFIDRPINGYDYLAVDLNKNGTIDYLYDLVDYSIKLNLGQSTDLEELLKLPYEAFISGKDLKDADGKSSLIFRPQNN